MPELPEIDDLSAETARKEIPQIFSTTVLSGEKLAPEITFLTLEKDPSFDLRDGLTEFIDDTVTESGYYLSHLEVREYIESAGREDFVVALAKYLRDGLNFPLPPSFNILDVDFRKMASYMIDNAEIPVRSSPLHGTTISALLSGSGVAVLIQLFHSGVSLEEASITVFFFAGSIIVFGAANGVRRAIEAGLEQTPINPYRTRRPQNNWRIPRV